jgi:hypothetical protein
MAAGRTGLDLPLALQSLAAWLAAWLGRVLQEQADFLKAENWLLSEKGELADATVQSDGIEWVPLAGASAAATYFDTSLT